MQAMEGLRAKWLLTASGGSWRAASAGGGGEGRPRCPVSGTLHLRAPGGIRHGGFSPMFLWRRYTAVVPALPRRLSVPFSGFPSAEKPEMADATQTGTELPKAAPESGISGIQNQTENGPPTAVMETQDATEGVLPSVVTPSVETQNATEGVLPSVETQNAPEGVLPSVETQNAPEGVLPQATVESLEVGREAETTEVQTQTSSEPSEANAEIEATQVKPDAESDGDSLLPTGPSRTVHVKFVLQRSCKYGEKYLLVGEDAALGSWKPPGAIPMAWSAGDRWVAEVVLPVGKEIEYKYILQALSGKIKWQPGFNRVLQTWETTNTIVVAGDWENADDQKIAEEEPIAVPAAGGTGAESEIGTGGEAGESSQEEAIADESRPNKVEITDEKPIGRKGEDRILVPGLASFPRSATEVASSEEAAEEVLSGASCESGEIASNVAEEVNV